MRILPRIEVFHVLAGPLWDKVPAIVFGDALIPWEILDETPVPGGKGKLQLARRGDEYVIRVDGKDLMSSRTHDSEKALADLTCGRVTRSDARVLVGGLGMGLKLAAALAGLPAKASVVLAELVHGVIVWNQGILGPLAGDPLKDSRVTVYEGDVRDLIKKPEDGFDAILLDVDNGPDGLTQESNSWLYQSMGLNAAMKALRKGGVLAVWSAFDAPWFTQRLRDAGFIVEVEMVRAHGNKGTRHTIWLAFK